MVKLSPPIILALSCMTYIHIFFFFLSTYIYGDKICIIAWHWLYIKWSTSINCSSMFCFIFFFLDDLEVHIFIHVLDIINSTGRNICTIEGADWHREEYYVQKKTDGGQKVAFHRYVSGTKHREMHFQTCRVTYF